MLPSKSERVFVIGASGDIGRSVVRGLIKRRIDTTAFVRNEEKAKDLFKDQLKTGHLKIVIGNYSSIDIYTEEIEGHTRLFILVADVTDQPTAMTSIKETFARIAFDRGVRQIVDLSSSSVSSDGKQGIIGYMHTTAEDKLWRIADQKPDERSIVVLRPGAFFTNHLMSDVHHVKHSNKLVSCGLPSSKLTWIDTKDIAECAIVILTESIKKHDRNIYQMGGETLSNEERAKIFSKVLNKPIIYEQQSVEDFYQTYINLGMSHSLVYNLISYFIKDHDDQTTQQLSLLLGRPLRTLEQWLNDNKQIFQ